MIDDELLQELLSKASGLYNNGEYRGAIDVWKEVLQLDGTSQKAREGIQMATLLLAGWESPAEAESEPAPAAPSDGAPADTAGLSREDIEARLDAGVARVHALLKERKYSEAVEGARGLVPFDPDSEEVQRLVEEAQQAFESAPFIEEHLLLARELAAQERFDEAETECRKVFALDPANPEGHALIADLRRRAPSAGPQAEPARAPVDFEELSDVGGSTIKIDLSQVLPQRSAPTSEASTPAADPAAETIPEPLPDDMFELDMEPSAAAAPEPAPAPDADAEFVDATTVVPPSQRLVPRAETPGETAEDLMKRLDREPVILPTQAQAASGPGGWEKELESLNVESGAHEIIGRSASMTASEAPQPEGEADLSSLLDDDIGPIPGMAPAGKPVAAEPAPEPSPRAVTSARAVERQAPGSAAPPPEPRSRAALPTYFALFGLLLVVAGVAAWWFLLQPRMAAGRAAAPPAGSPPPSASSGLQPGGNSGPIPTPIGSTSKQPIEPLRSQEEAQAPAAAPAAPDTMAQAPVPAPADGTRNSPAPPSAAAGPGAAVEDAPEPAPEIVVRPKSPEDLKRAVARHMADGRRFVAQEKWREARSEFASALALDPVNFECKELLDQTQTHVDQELKVQKELDEARQAFTDKDYQGALWKLYRLPKSPIVGNVDRYIRNAWFNWAVVGLKGGDASDARQKLSEVLSADPDDAEAQKLQEIAVRYASKPKDRIFYSFVDTLHYRGFDQE